MENRKKVLIVDDDPDHLLICNILLRRRGFDVLPLLGCDPLNNLTDAIDAYFQKPFHAGDLLTIADRFVA